MGWDMAPFKFRKVKMTDLAILIPVLRRPKNISPLVESILNTTKAPYEIVFIVSPGDHEEISELENQALSYIVMEASYENYGDYARKINAGFDSVEANWYFLGADDLRFHPLWFEVAMEFYERTGASVIGTNDLGSPVVMSGQHSTHSLVLRDYVLNYGTVDEPGKVLHEGYPHEYVDVEFVETAKWRRKWTFATVSRVEHLHPNWGKGTMDSLYAAQPQRMMQGKRIYEQRKLLWR